MTTYKNIEALRAALERARVRCDQAERDYNQVVAEASLVASASQFSIDDNGMIHIVIRSQGDRLAVEEAIQVRDWLVALDLDETGGEAALDAKRNNVIAGLVRALQWVERAAKSDTPEMWDAVAIALREADKLGGWSVMTGDGGAA